MTDRTQPAQADPLVKRYDKDFDKRLKIALGPVLVVISVYVLTTYTETYWYILGILVMIIGVKDTVTLVRYLHRKYG